jgi:hypothetical protein
MSLGRRFIWLGICGMLMQLGLGVAWMATVLMSVSHLTVRRPALREVYLKVQQKQMSPLTPSSSDAERFFESMAPIFSQLHWPLIAVVSSVLSFAVLGFLYARITGTTDYLGLLPVLGLLSGQNPITMAMAFAEQGVTQARFSHPLELVILLTQLLTLYAFGALGCWFHRRKQASRPPVTKR